MSHRLPILLLAFLAPISSAKDDAMYQEKVLPFIENHCVDCHDSSSARAGFRIDLLTNNFTIGWNTMPKRRSAIRRDFGRK